MISLASESFTYDDGVPLLVGVNLTVPTGGYLLIAGASSSGKTTLARLLAGQTGTDGDATFRGSLTLDAESIHFAGVPADPRIDPAAWSERVGFVAQGAWGQLSMMSATVAEEIAFGPANRGVPAPELQTLVADVAAALDLTELLARDPRTLSGGQLQRTVIAGAMAQGPDVLILDEPFHGLDDMTAQGVADALVSLRAGGTAVVVCEPMLPRTAPADARVLALADGHAVFAGLLAEARSAGLRRYGIGTMGEAPRPAAGVRKRATPGKETVRLHGVGFTHTATAAERTDAGRGRGRGRQAGTIGLVDVHLSVRAGEIVALRGANGSGKSTLLQHLNGLCRAQAGAVVVAGVTITRQPTGTLAGHVGYLFQDTDQQLFERTVLREVSYGPLLARARRTDAERRASEALARVGLGELEQVHPYELGFAQRRLVALASMMAGGPLIWALDEPTAGLDDPTRTLMADLLLEHAASGGAVILATHDAAFADDVADRSIWLESGRVLPGSAPD